ncbi:amidase family protein [Subtercola sp. YIM 133946]|uniref:amidase family protein n=1 Tax=Subtercola sp. YIM 133946 TaxID=3118909 RepID=UPI002F94371E
MTGTPEPHVDRVDRTVWRIVGSPLVAGAAEGTLRGETVAVKDFYSISGFAVGAGVPQYLAESAPALATAPAVTALLAAGASVTGIAHMDEFAYSLAGTNSHYGTPPNPAVPHAIPGGSSSGPVAAVALGQASIGLGTDTAGSVRVPASYQGLWGLRGTHDAVSLRDTVAMAPSFDAAGWLTAAPETLRAAASASVDLRAQRPALREFVTAPAITAHAEPAVRDAFEQLAHGEAVELGDPDELMTIFRTIQAAEVWRTHGKWITQHPGALGPDIAARFAFAATISGRQEASARSALEDARARIDEVLGDRILLLPSASSAAPSLRATVEQIEVVRAGTLRLTCIAAIGGRPGLSVPALSVRVPGSDAFAPVGLGLVGPRYSDLSLIDAAEASFRVVETPRS